MNEDQKKRKKGIEIGKYMKYVMHKKKGGSRILINLNFCFLITSV